jgi:Domain of unknown function (DUF5916)
MKLFNIKPFQGGFYSGWLRHSLLISATLFALASVSHAKTTKPRIDGAADEAHWQQARSISDLTLTAPETGAAPDFKTEIRWLALPEGLSFHFRNLQDEARYPKRAQRQLRDNLGGTDRVNVMIDFDGAGQSGYNMTVSRSNSIEDSTISNENTFNPDWDGVWQHATRELPDQQGWEAELLIPWSSALMRKASSATRTIGLYVDRVIGSADLRAAKPSVIFFRPQFLSLFEQHDIPAFSQSLFKIYPYVTAQVDLQGGDRNFRTGVDIFWKPSSDLQITAAINPDFGQVESDDLVVNFDAVELFFSDKRPFFTENQSIFVLQSPEQESLIYTRRAGGNRDDGNGVSDIDVASKISGSVAGFDYGVFAVAESDRDEVGRSIAALRSIRPNIELGTAKLDLGVLTSSVKRPFLERDSQLISLDAKLEFGRWQLGGVALNTSPDDDVSLLNSGSANVRRASSGHGGWLSSSYRPSETFELEMDYTRYDKDVDFNDLGFQRRNNLALFEIEPTWRLPDLQGRLGLRSASISLDGNVSENHDGQLLRKRFELGAELSYAGGSTGYIELSHGTRGIDDLISRGNGALNVTATRALYLNHDSVRAGNWKWGGEFFIEGGGTRKRIIDASPALRYWFSDAFSTRFGLGLTRFDERLLWRSGTLFGRFEQTQGASARVDLEWFHGDKHEIRLKTELLGVSGRDAAALTLQANRNLSASTAAVQDFSIQNFGFQLRYRYRINQESDLFVVYSRGGDRFDSEYQRAFELIDNAIELKDTDQMLVKLRYGF